MLNKVFLLGRLGKDPIVKHFQNDGAIAEFTLATTESYKDKEGKWKEVTDWHTIKCPNKFSAERAEKYLKKGSLVHIEGKLKTRSYDDKDGNKRYVTEVVVDSFKLLDKKDDKPEDTYARAEQAPITDGSDDLPFALLALIGMSLMNYIIF